MAENNINIEKTLEDLDAILNELKNTQIDIQKSVELYKKSIELAEPALEYLKETKGKLEKLNLEVDKLIDLNK